MNKKLQIFVSSTYKDLKLERQAAVDAILKSGHIPAGMELFSAGDESQWVTIQRWIDASDVYMLILGGRYGTVEKKTALSYTELEYDYALSKDMPVFAVVATEDALDAKVAAGGREMLEAENPKELKLFREKALNLTSAFFDEPKDIKLAVHETLSDFQARHEFSGWVPGSEVSDSKELMEDIRRLSQQNGELETENRELAAQIERLSKKGKTNFSEEEFEEILRTLRPMEISTSIGAEEGDEPRRLSLVSIINATKDNLVTGVENRHDMSDLSSLLFFNVFPKLKVFGLAEPEKIAGVQYRRKRLNAKGRDFLVWMETGGRFKEFSSDTKKKSTKKSAKTKGAKKSTRTNDKKA